MSAPQFTAEAVGKLSAKQRDVLGLVCIGKDGGHSPRTLAALLGKGWIVARKEALAGAPSIAITRYDVSCVAAHMAWCFWCSENVTDEDIAAADAEEPGAK